MNDNLDLQLRRKRLRLNQRDVAAALGLTRPAYISDFETKGDSLPHGLSRQDYERVLDEAERSKPRVGAA